MSNDESDDGSKPTYKVGYGQPPTVHRFKPGQSGNSAGRPRKAKSIGEEFAAGMLRPVMMSTNGKRRKTNTVEIAVLRAMKDIATGSPRALERWIGLMERYAPTSTPRIDKFLIDMDLLTDDQLRLIASIKLKHQ